MIAVMVMMMHGAVAEPKTFVAQFPSLPACAKAEPYLQFVATQHWPQAIINCQEQAAPVYSMRPQKR